MDLSCSDCGSLTLCSAAVVFPTLQSFTLDRDIVLVTFLLPRQNTQLLQLKGRQVCFSSWFSPQSRDSRHKYDGERYDGRKMLNPELGREVHSSQACPQGQPLPTRPCLLPTCSAMNSSVGESTLQTPFRDILYPNRNTPKDSPGPLCRGPFSTWVLCLTNSSFPAALP